MICGSRPWFNSFVLAAWNHRKEGTADFWHADPGTAPRVEAWWRGDLGGLTPVQSSPYATVHRDADFFYKRFHLRGPRDRLKHLFRASRARRALLNGETMEAAGFHAPVAVALVEQRGGLGVGESGLVTRAIADAPSTRDWLNRPDLGVARDLRAKRDFLRAFGRTVGRFHAAGFHHGDLRIGNVLARRAGETWTWYWLDNERNEKFAALPRALRVHNLMQVNMERAGVMRSDRLRFWRAYVEASRLPEPEQRLVRQEVIAYTRARWIERGWLPAGSA